MLQTLFRRAIVEAMPAPIQNKLDKVVGLTSMSSPQFHDHVAHALEKQRKDGRKIRTKIWKENWQLQLEELHGEKRPSHRPWCSWKKKDQQLTNHWSHSDLYKFKLYHTPTHV